MRKSEYLYGKRFDPKLLSKMTYIEALEYKISCAKENIEDIISDPNWNGNKIKVVSDAIRHNERLIDETNGRDPEWNDDGRNEDS